MMLMPRCVAHSLQKKFVAKLCVNPLCLSLVLCSCVSISHPYTVSNAYVML